MSQESVPIITIPSTPSNHKIFHEVCEDDSELKSAAALDGIPWTTPGVAVTPQRHGDTSHSTATDPQRLSMTNDSVSRYELDAKLEAIESRMDARLARIESATDSFRAEALEIKKTLANTKWWAIGTAVAVLSTFIVVLTWGLSAQKEENARFNSYMREDVKSIHADVKAVTADAQVVRAELKTVADSVNSLIRVIELSQQGSTNPPQPDSPE